MRQFRVAFSVYQSAFQAPGGGEVQLLKTKEALEKEGVEIKLFSAWTDKLKDFDILHIFGSVKDSYGLMESARAQGVKIALSTICWYSWKSAWGTHGTFTERFLAVARHTGKYFFPFISSRRKSMMHISDLLLPNSESEAYQLRRFFGVPKDRIFTIPNAVDESFLNGKPELFTSKYGVKDFVLSVGRIEPRKNQLQLIKALNKTSIPVVLIGDYVPAYKSYYDLCRKEAWKNIHFLGSIPHDASLLAAAYAAARVFVLPSWLETPGLAALEAGISGTPIVITQEGATREYFDKFALYVDPRSVKDIRNKTFQQFNQPRNKNLQQHIQNNFLWCHAANKTLAAYCKLLEK